jgi:hypothetical protein
MAQAQRVEYLRAVLQDRPGSLLEVMQSLKGKNVSLKALWGFAKQDGTGEIYAIAKDNSKLRGVLNALGLQTETGTAFFLKGTDKAGVLVKNLEALANNEVNIRGIQAVALSGKYGALVWVKESDIEKAVAALGAK